MRSTLIAFATSTLCTMRRSRKSRTKNDESTIEMKQRRSPKRARIANYDVKPEPAMVHDIEELPSTTGMPSEESYRHVLSMLRGIYGRRTPSTKRQPVLDSLIATILSQATTNANSSRAFKYLKTAYPTWSVARSASSTDIAATIRAGGLADQKAPRILAILNKLGEDPSLEHLRDLTNEQVKKELCLFPGVGPKTAACVLMFNMQRAEFPVDTHVRRLCGRIGWTESNATPEKVYNEMNACLPDDIKYEMHVLLIEHGRKICKARAPKCDECALTENCRFFAENMNREKNIESSVDGSVEVESIVQVKTESVSDKLIKTESKLLDEKKNR